MCWWLRLTGKSRKTQSKHFVCGDKPPYQQNVKTRGKKFTVGYSDLSPVIFKNSAKLTLKYS